MTQPSLLDDATLEDRILDRSEAHKQTEAGVKKAAKKLADPEALAWREAALLALERVALRARLVTGDGVWQELGDVDERYGSQMGLVFRIAKRLGWIAPTGGFIESQRPSRHRSGIRVWNSLVYQG